MLEKLGFQAALPALVAFVISLIAGKLMIPLLTRLKCGQYIREDGPQEHLKKQGTPTMGAIFLLIGFAAGALIFVKVAPEVLPLVLVTLAFGLIGFLDDFLKVVLKHNEGLKAAPKFILQVLVSAGFAFYLYKAGYSTAIELPFGGKLELGFFYYPLVVLFMTAFDNGTNFTDGLDGLLASVTAVITVFFGAAALMLGRLSTVTASAMLGGLLGFLVYNAHPAKVFMGDTGSLAIGGFVSAFVLMLNRPLILLLVGFIYVIEVLSVILQVGYFKLTKGKRLFRMAPIHHHFELKGWPETRVVARFTVLTAVLCFIGFMLL